MTLIKKVKEYIIKEGLLKKGDQILVGFSGGADSLALILLLENLKNEMGISIGAAHLNHGLRGKEADEDEAFCQTFCLRRNIPFYSQKYDVGRYAMEQKISIEVAGREKRYAFFKEIMINKRYNQCATAHHKEDQAETILLHVMRGASLPGLIGMQPRRGHFIKPLLGIHKEELMDYLNQEGISPREDKTNLESLYQRNKVRNHLIPYIKENFNADIIGTLDRMGRLLQKDADYLNQEVNQAKKSVLVIEEPSQRIVLKKEASLLHEAMTSRLVLEALKELKHNLKDIEEVHVRDVITLGQNVTGKSIHLKEGIMVKNNYGDLIFEKQENIKKDKDKKEELNMRLEIPGEYQVEGKKIRLRVISKEEMQKEKTLRFFNGDVMEDTVLLRHRKDGDTMRPLGMGGYKKIKNILIDRKIDREKREQLFIFQHQKDILYIGEMMISDDYKVKESTKRVVEIGIFEEDGND